MKLVDVKDLCSEYVYVKFVDVKEDVMYHVMYVHLINRLMKTLRV